jgi:hypothetical protein
MKFAVALFVPAIIFGFSYHRASFFGAESLSAAQHLRVVEPSVAQCETGLPSELMKDPDVGPVAGAFASRSTCDDELSRIGTSLNEKATEAHNLWLSGLGQLKLADSNKRFTRFLELHEKRNKIPPWCTCTPPKPSPPGPTEDVSTPPAASKIKAIKQTLPSGGSKTTPKAAPQTVADVSTPSAAAEDSLQPKVTNTPTMPDRPLADPRQAHAQQQERDRVAALEAKALLARGSDPFAPPAAAMKPSDLEPALKVANVGISRGKTMLAHNLEAAAATLKGTELTRYKQSAAATNVILGGLKKIADIAEYGVAVGSIVTSEGEERGKAIADLARTLTKEIGKKSITVTVTQIFGKEAAGALVGGPVGFVTAVAWDVMTPVYGSRDTWEIIHDNAGVKSTLAEKQKALTQEWMSWSKNRNTWGTNQYQQLLEDTLLVKQQADKVSPNGLPR